MSAPVLKSSATLNAVAKLIPLYCGDENRSFLQCKKSSRDPASCLAEGTNVTACVFKLCVRSHAPAFHFSGRDPLSSAAAHRSFAAAASPSRLTQRTLSPPLPPVHRSLLLAAQRAEFGRKGIRRAWRVQDLPHSSSA